MLIQALECVTSLSLEWPVFEALSQLVSLVSTSFPQLERLRICTSIQYTNRDGATLEPAQVCGTPFPRLRAFHLAVDGSSGPWLTRLLPIDNIHTLAFMSFRQVDYGAIADLITACGPSLTELTLAFYKAPSLKHFSFPFTLAQNPNLALLCFSHSTNTVDWRDMHWVTEVICTVPPTTTVKVKFEVDMRDMEAWTAIDFGAFQESLVQGGAAKCHTLDVSCAYHARWCTEIFRRALPDLVSLGKLVI
ncbi:hypothetical protein DXG01_005692 [Tephrocybe rancida]|nr:hypothetical protein DXG01_005692 [Tephrocybe rancida]